MANSGYQSTMTGGIIARRQTARPASLALLLALSVLAAGCATQNSSSVRQDSAPIAIQSVRLTAADHYIDLRYRVVDPAAAQLALGPKVRPRLIDETTGAVMAVPTTAKLGSLRQTQAIQKPDRTYFVMFINNGVRPGSRVTAELGELKFKHLVVE